MRLWHGRELSVRPSGCPFLWGMGEGCMATMRSAMCISSGSRALGWLVQISASVSWEETGSGFSYGWGVWITATGQHCWNKVCLGSSVYACAKCVCGCVFVRVCAVCVRCPVCFSGVLTEALHGICSPPFGNTSLRRNKRRGEGRGGKKFYSSNTQSDFLIKQIWWFLKRSNMSCSTRFS